MTDVAMITDWHGCYEGGWQDAIVPEAFAHPAKFSRSLIVRIIRHGLDRGYWKPGDTIGDCFGGVALGGIIAGYHGLNWIGVELEPRFVELGNKNLAMHGPRWMALEQATSVRLVQGDSRRFAEIVGEVCGVVSSPPYAESLTRDKRDDGAQDHRAATSGVICWGSQAGGERSAVGYGETAGQIGSLPAGQLDAVVSSPPYADSIHQTINGIDWEKADPKWNTSLRKDTPGRKSIADGYGVSDGQIGSLRSGEIDAVVTSPPFEDTAIGTNRSLVEQKAAWNSDPKNANKPGFRPNQGAKVLSDQPSTQDEYGDSDGQIGNDSGETYWQAMRQVYAQMHAALKPGGVCAIVVKDYVKDKARVPLCDQTCTMLDALGFAVFERCRCWLVKRDEHPGLFGEPVVKTTERKSLFRRLAEKKGSPRIDWEEVIWCQR